MPSNKWDLIFGPFESYRGIHETGWENSFRSDKMDSNQDSNQRCWCNLVNKYTKPKAEYYNFHRTFHRVKGVHKQFLQIRPTPNPRSTRIRPTTKLEPIYKTRLGWPQPPVHIWIIKSLSDVIRAANQTFAKVPDTLIHNMHRHIMVCYTRI